MMNCEAARSDRDTQVSKLTVYHNRVPSVKSTKDKNLTRALTNQMNPTRLSNE